MSNLKLKWNLKFKFIKNLRFNARILSLKHWKFDRKLEKNKIFSYKIQILRKLNEIWKFNLNLWIS